MEQLLIHNKDGNIEKVEIVKHLKIKELNRDFIIYSKNEKIGHEISKVYVSEIIEDKPGSFRLVGINDEDVWDKVKQTMKNIIGN